ncbi:MAG: M13 family peptidase, partial [Muribaculaceae bacterium]|nr:M13 family peptidase [Muribaculaceae bacterium]
MKKGINKRNLDTAANLRDDFYLYSCGGWIERHPMKEHHSRYGMFDFIRDKASKQLKELVKTLGENPDAHKRGTIANKINVIYNQVLDKERLKREGASPILPLVEKLEKDKLRNLSRLISKLHHGYSDVFFGAGVTVDAADSNAHIFGLTEVGLTLGDRDYYLEDNEKNREILEEYRNYIEKIMRLVGYSTSESERIRKTVEKMEREFASHKHTREERRDPTLRYNVFSVDELKKRYTFLDWDLYFKELKVNPEKVNITNPAFFDFLNEYIKTLTPREIKDYFIYDVVSDASGLLGEKFEKLNFRMFGQVMSGAKRRTPRWEKALGMVNSMFGEAIGQLYVEKYFPKANKDYMV